MKRCSKCKLTKDESEFNKRKASKDGLQYRCIVCNVSAITAKRQTEEGRDAHKAAQYKYYRTPKGKEVHDRAYKKWAATEHGKENIRVRGRRNQYKRYKSDPEYFHLKNRAYHAGCDVGVLKQVKDRDKVCRLCGSDQQLEYDHIFPLSLGGKGDFTNLQLLCSPCNKFKSNNLFLPGGGMLVTQACNI